MKYAFAALGCGFLVMAAVLVREGLYIQALSNVLFAVAMVFMFMGVSQDDRT